MNLIKLPSDLPESRNSRKALIDILPDTLDGNAGVGFTRDCISSMDTPDIGYYSWQFQRMHGDLDSDKLHMDRFENLQEDFVSIMRSLEVEQADAIEAKFDTSPRLNTSRHSHYSKYMDDEFRELVANWSRTGREQGIGTDQTL